MKVTTADRLKWIMKERNLRQADIINAARPYCEQYGIKLERNALSQYVSGKVLPRQDRLTILGLALNVSEAWLMGYDVPMERDDAAATPGERTPDEEAELMEYLEELRRNPELRMMFSLTKGAKKEDVQKAVAVVRALMGKDDGDA